MSATVLFPIFGSCPCHRCGREISRETRVTLAFKSGQGDCRSWGDLLCAKCERQPFTTITEFSAYLTQSGFGSTDWRDPASPCA